MLILHGSLDDCLVLKFYMLILYIMERVDVLVFFNCKELKDNISDEFLERRWHVPQIRTWSSY